MCALYEIRSIASSRMLWSRILCELKSVIVRLIRYCTGNHYPMWRIYIAMRVMQYTYINVQLRWIVRSLTYKYIHRIYFLRAIVCLRYVDSRHFEHSTFGPMPEICISYTYLKWVLSSILERNGRLNCALSILVYLCEAFEKKVFIKQLKSTDLCAQLKTIRILNDNDGTEST